MVQAWVGELIGGNKSEVFGWRKRRSKMSRRRGGNKTASENRRGARPVAGALVQCKVGLKKEGRGARFRKKMGIRCEIQGFQISTEIVCGRLPQSRERKATRKCRKSRSRGASTDSAVTNEALERRNPVT